MKYCSRRYCILLGLILSIFVCACSVSEKKNVDDGIVEDKIQTNTSKEDTKIKAVETEDNLNNTPNSLIYREYEIGTQHSSGDVISIDTVGLSKIVSNPEVIVVFYNDEILCEIPWTAEIEKTETSVSEEVSNYVELITLH